MAKIAVCESIGAVLEPNDDRVEFADGPDARMMDIVVYNKVGDSQTQGCIHCVCKRNKKPGRLKFSLLFLVSFGSGIFLPPSHNTLGLLRSSQFDYVCNKEMTWYKRKED